jgi:hypothetical protein
MMAASETAQSALLVPLLSGLAGSIITVTVQYLRDWLIQPSLKVTAHAGVGGCVVQTPAFDKKTLQHSGDQRYLRLRIDNDGRTTAKNVCISIIKIMRQTPGSGQESFDEEVMDLTYPFARGGESVTTVDMPPKTHRFINLCHTTKMLGGGQEFLFDVEVLPIRMKAMYGNSAADFRIELMIAADNVMGGRVGAVSVRYGGTLESLAFLTP